MKIIMVILLLVSFNCNAVERFYLSGEYFSSNRSPASNGAILYVQIMSNRSNMDSKFAFRLARVIRDVAKKYGVPANVVAGIAFVESSYKLNAVNKASNDYGIMQVNGWHVRNSKLSVDKLLTDLEYSVEHGVRIFKWFYNKYPLDEAIARYNCGVRKDCIKWKKVKRYVDLVKKAM